LRLSKYRQVKKNIEMYLHRSEKNMLASLTLLGIQDVHQHPRLHHGCEHGLATQLEAMVVSMDFRCRSPTMSRDIKATGGQCMAALTTPTSLAPKAGVEILAIANIHIANRSQ